MNEHNDVSVTYLYANEEITLIYFDYFDNTYCFDENN